MIYQDRFQAIYERGAESGGYFTAGQASAAGIPDQLISYHRRAGNIVRVSRGVYRLRDFPLSSLDQYIAASMWPVPITATLSHETALDLLGLSDVNPSQIHLTVPRAFRIRRREVPKLYVVHRADLADDEVTSFEGIPVTTPVRTIRDCQRANLGPALMRQAINDGRRNGKLSGADVEQLMYEFAAYPDKRASCDPRLE